MNSSFPTSFDRPCRPAVGRRGRIVVLCGLVACGLSRVSPVHSAQNASDNACNYSGTGDWTGTNGGSGFSAWFNKQTGGGGGFFRGSSLINAGGSSGGHINTSCSGNFSWGMYAGGWTPGANYARIWRAFTAGSTPANTLQVGQIFTIDFDNGYINSGGQQGFALQNSSYQDVLQFRFLGGQCCYQINGSSPSPTIGFTGNGLRVRVILTSSSTCTVQVQTPNTSTTTNSYNVSLLNPSGGQAISQVVLFVDGSGAGSDYDAFFNSMSVSCPSFTVSAPTNQTVCSGSTAVFSVSVTGAATPTYQWQYSSDNGSTWQNVSGGSGATTASYTTAATTPAQNGWQFRCVVTDACGNAQNSSAAALTVNPSPTAGSDTVSRAPNLGLKIAKSILLTNDSSGAVFAALNTPTANGVSLTMDATHIFYPANATNLNDSFTYVVTNSNGCSASATVTINVTAPAAAQALSVTPQGGSVTAQFAGIPNYPYAVERATNVAFTLGTNTWFTNAPAGGVFQITDNFSDLGGPPGQAFYRLRYNP